MPRPPLHPRQCRILTFIADAIEDEGIPPTIRDLGAHLKTSTSPVVYHITRLETLGLVRRCGGPAVSRSTLLTKAGYEAIGRVAPADDLALGRALRRAAASGDESTAALVEAVQRAVSTGEAVA